MFADFGALALFLVGLVGLAVKKDLFRAIIGIFVMESAVEVFLLSRGEVSGGTMILSLAAVVVLTALALRMKEMFGDFDIARIRKLKG